LGPPQNELDGRNCVCNYGGESGGNCVCNSAAVTAAVTTAVTAAVTAAVSRSRLLVMFEILHSALMLLRRRARLERPEILPLSRLVLLARVQAIPAVLHFPNHMASCVTGMTRKTVRRDKPMAM